jgi:hypothetical protein
MACLGTFQVQKFVEDQSKLGGGFSLKRKRKEEEAEEENRKHLIEKMSKTVDTTR